MIARERLFKIGNLIVKCTPEDLDYLLRGLKIVEGLDVEGVEEVDVSKIKFERVMCNEKWNIREIESRLGLIDLNDPTKAHHTAVIVGKKGMIARAVDVSRHNAILKAIGMCLEDFSRVFLLVSSRVTFDIANLCYKAKIPVIVTRKAVTDLAIEVCKKAGITLVSFGNKIVVGDAVEGCDTGWRKG